MYIQKQNKQTNKQTNKSKTKNKAKSPSLFIRHMTLIWIYKMKLNDPAEDKIRNADVSAGGKADKAIF